MIERFPVRDSPTLRHQSSPYIASRRLIWSALNIPFGKLNTPCFFSLLGYFCGTSQHRAETCHTCFRHTLATEPEIAYLHQCCLAPEKQPFCERQDFQILNCYCTSFLNPPVCQNPLKSSALTDQNSTNCLKIVAGTFIIKSELSPIL